jgi:HK97 family phage portal protein
VGLVDRVNAEHRRKTKPRSWPVGKGSLAAMDSTWGHDDSLYSPEEYGDALVTSNEVYSAVTLRARLMSSLHLQLFRGRDAKKKAVTSGPAARLLQHVNPFWTFPRLMRMDELAMGLWGETYWAIERDQNGVPSEIWWLKASRVKPVPHETNYLKGFLYEPEVGGPQIPFSPDEIVWQRYPNPLDEFSALSPMSAARLAAETASAMMTSNRRLFENGLQLGGIVVPTTDKVTFSPDQAADLESQLERRFRGVDKAHKWAVLRYEAQFRGLDVTPHDAEFLGGLNLTLRQVANAYGIPVPLLNDLEHSTLANLRELMRAVWENTLIPDATLRAAEIEEQLLPMFPGQRRPDHCAWDYSQVPALQESASDSWARDRQAIEIGALTINEVRQSKGLPPVPWGDSWWAPVNKAAVNSADDHPEGDTAPADSSAPAETGDAPAPAAEEDERAWGRLLAALSPGEDEPPQPANGYRHGWPNAPR